MVSVLLLVGVAAAGPPKYRKQPATSTAPAIVEAERLWNAAANVTDRSLESDAWARAAEAFLAATEIKTLSKTEQMEAAYSAVLAMKNALNVDPRIKDPDAPKQIEWDRKPTPKQIPPRDQRFIQIVRAYLKYDATSDEAVGMKFLYANVLRRYDRFDEAIPIFTEVLEHKNHETAEFAANLLLDTYNRLQRYDELVALADRLRADTAFMAKHEDLARTVLRIHIRGQVLAAEHCTKDATDRTQQERCGDMYMAIVADDKDQGDESLYNALVNYHSAGAIERVREIDARFDKQFPRSRLRIHAKFRRIKLEEDIGNYAVAAELGERLLTRLDPTTEKDTSALAEEVTQLRLTLGDLAAAERDLAKLAALVKPFQRGRVGGLTLQLVAAHLARGNRADARRLALGDNIRMFDPNPWAPLDAALVLLDAACPKPLVDGLCLHARQRDVMDVARSKLNQVRDRDDNLGRVLLDLRLEEALRGRRNVRVDDLAYAYRALVRNADPNIRAAGHARLARLARAQKQNADAAKETEACIREVRTSLAAHWWGQICERERAALKLPPLDPMHERLGYPTTRTEIAIEPPP